MFSMSGIIILTMLISSFNVKGGSGLLEVQDRQGERVLERCFMECGGLNRPNVDFSCVSKCAHEKLNKSDNGMNWSEVDDEK